MEVALRTLPLRAVVSAWYLPLPSPPARQSVGDSSTAVDAIRGAPAVYLYKVESDDCIFKMVQYSYIPL